jgi:hypothetical protein
MRKRTTSGSLGDVVGGVVGRIDKGKNLSQARIAQVWRDAVGQQIARHTAGVHIRGDEVVVYVDSPIWATELSALSTQLAKRLNECLGEELVGLMRFSVSRRVVEERARERSEEELDEFYAAEVVRPIPLSAQEVEQVRQSASAIRNEALRETVIRATIKDLEYKRGRALKGGRERAE